MKKIICSITLVFVLLLCSCLNIKEAYNSQSVSAESLCTEVQFDKDYSDIVTFTNKKILYFKYDKDDTRHYYVNDLKNNTISSVGEIKNAFASPNSTAIVNDNVYFNALIGNWGDYSNSLFSIDLNKNSIKAVDENMKLYDTFVYNVATKDKVLLLKGDLNKSKTEATSYVDMYDMGKGNSKNIITELVKIKGKSYVGDEIKFITYYKDIIYTLEKEFINNNFNFNFWLVKYDMNGKEIGRINLNSIQNLITGETIGNFRVLGDYIYIKTFSSTALICSIKDNNLKIIGPKNYNEYKLDIAVSSSYVEQQYYVFYERDKTDELVILDTVNNKLLKSKLNLDENYNSIGFIYADEKNNLFISLLMPDDGIEKKRFSANLDYFLPNAVEIDVNNASFNSLN